MTPDARKANVSVYEYMETKATPQQRLDSLAAASDKLPADFGTWKTPWGDINRFQRLDRRHRPAVRRRRPEHPGRVHLGAVGLARVVRRARLQRARKKMYGTSGNSFVAVVEFGDQVRAKAVTAGGESGDPKSPHFNDQAQRYATGDLRDVYFYRQQLEGHTKKTYRPGE